MNDIATFDSSYHDAPPALVASRILECVSLSSSAHGSRKSRRAIEIPPATEAIEKFEFDYEVAQGLRVRRRRTHEDLGAVQWIDDHERDLKYEQNRAIIENVHARREPITYRLVHGYEGVLDDGTIIHEIGLRSEAKDAHVLHRFTNGTPKARRKPKTPTNAEYRSELDRFAAGTTTKADRKRQALLRSPALYAGDEKGILDRQESKLLGLDCRYIQLNEIMRPGWRDDLDREFESLEALLFELHCLVDAGKLPCLPHDITWENTRRWRKHGEVARPHIWWFLPPNCKVWYDPSDPRCRRHVMKFFDAVRRGSCAALLPLGADPSALALFGKGKNPLCPKMWHYSPNQTIFPTLTQWSRFVDTSLRPADLSRMASAYVDPSKPTHQSLGDFYAIREILVTHLRRWQRDEDKSYLAVKDDPSKLAALLEEQCEDEVVRAISGGLATRATISHLRRCCASTAEWWRPLGGRMRDRGAIRDRISDLETTSEKQAAGANYSSALKQSRNHRRILDAIEHLKSRGLTATVKAISEATGISTKTVRKHLKDGTPESPEMGRKDESDAGEVESLVPQREIAVNDGMRIPTWTDGSNCESVVVSEIVIPVEFETSEAIVIPTVEIRPEATEDGEELELEGVSMRDDGTDFEMKRRAIGRQMFRRRSGSIMAISSVGSSIEMLRSPPMETPVENGSRAALERHDETNDVPKTPVTQAASPVDRKTSVNTLKPLPLRRRPPVSDRQIEARPFVMDEEIEKFLREWTAEPTVEDLKRMADRRNKRRIPMKGDR